MMQLLYFLFGMFIIYTLIRYAFPKPLTIKIKPTIDNYNDITYVDETGKIYKYELVEM